MEEWRTHTREVTTQEQEGLNAVKEKFEDLSTSKIDDLSTEEINKIIELTNNAEEEKFELSSATYSNYEQKQFTLKSTEFNLKSRVFNDFFPELKQETKDNIKFNNETTNPRAHISHDTKPWPISGFD